ncbi:MAG TPA: MlaD family protein [Planctomycetota bacterium]|nr:MlaD family protein [Planctomycetota bacterium]
MSNGALNGFSWKEIVLGLAGILGLGAAGYFGVKYLNVARLWKRRQEILVVFENVGSLTRNAPVRYNGIEIGRVKSLQPVHLDEKIIGERFRTLTRRDINNLPIRTDALKRELLELASDEFDKQCRQKLVGTSMIELSLEVLNDNDPIRYRLDDEIRIDATVFGDSSVEIISGSGPINDSPNQYVIGNSGDFFSNLSNSMSEVRDILAGVKDVIGTEERKNFAKSQARYTPLNDRIAALNKNANERMEKTLKRYSALTDCAREKLNKTGDVLQSFQPAAEEATDSIQKALKEIERMTTEARNEASSAMDEIKSEYETAQESVRVPIQQVRDGIDGIKSPLIAAKTDVEKAPARLDSGYDAAGSMQLQSVDDMNRFSESAKKSLLNLKITAFVARENKDLMISRRDAGENFAQTALDVHRRLGAISSRMLNAASDVYEAAHDMEADVAADPTIARAENAVRKLNAARAPFDEMREVLGAEMYRPWTERKRAAWTGDGLPRGN